MATVYLNKLTQLIADLGIEEELVVEIEVKHFFSGAALYANGAICASWSPGGLAFKLSEPEVARLLTSGKAVALKYFEKGRIKKGYAMFEDPERGNKNRWKNYFLKAIEQTS